LTKIETTTKKDNKMSNVIVISITGTAEVLVISPALSDVKHKEIVIFENHSNVTVYINFINKMPFRREADDEFYGEFGLVEEGVIGGVVKAKSNPSKSYNFSVQSEPFGVDNGDTIKAAPAHGEIVVE
jgi:hypothetical protein